MNDLDFIQIAAKSQSPNEAALIANTFAKKYLEFNLLENRKQITVIKEFLGKDLIDLYYQPLYPVESQKGITIYKTLPADFVS